MKQQLDTHHTFVFDNNLTLLSAKKQENEIFAVNIQEKNTGLLINQMTLNKYQLLNQIKDQDYIICYIDDSLLYDIIADEYIL